MATRRLLAGPRFAVPMIIVALMAGCGSDSRDPIMPGDTTAPNAVANLGDPVVETW